MFAHIKSLVLTLKASHFQSKEWGGAKYSNSRLDDTKKQHGPGFNSGETPQPQKHKQVIRFLSQSQCHQNCFGDTSLENRNHQALKLTFLFLFFFFFFYIFYHVGQSIRNGQIIVTHVNLGSNALILVVSWSGYSKIYRQKNRLSSPWTFLVIYFLTACYDCHHF